MIPERTVSETSTCLSLCFYPGWVNKSQRFFDFPVSSPVGWLTPAMERENIAKKTVPKPLTDSMEDCRIYPFRAQTLSAAAGDILADR